MRKTLNLIKARYGRPATYVTENGLCAGASSGASLDAALDDPERVAYVSGYLKSVLESIDLDDADVRGYFAWSFFDNFEWADGVAQRFGMVHVDHFGEFGGEWTARRPKKSLAAYREFMIGKHSKKSEGAVASEMGGFGGFGGFSASAAPKAEKGVDERLYQPFAWEKGESSAASGGAKLAALGAATLAVAGKVLDLY